MPKRRRKKEVRSKKLKVRIVATRKDKDRENKEVNQPVAVMANENEFNQEKDEQKKRLIMWLGVGGIMAALLIVWLFNLKYEFKASVKKSASSGFNWSQTKSELDKAMNQVKQGLSETKKIQANLKSKAAAGQAELTPEQINLLKGKLLNEAATGTASSTEK